MKGYACTSVSPSSPASRSSSATSAASRALARCRPPRADDSSAITSPSTCGARRERAHGGRVGVCLSWPHLGWRMAGRAGPVPEAAAALRQPPPCPAPVDARSHAWANWGWARMGVGGGWALSGCTRPEAVRVRGLKLHASDFPQCRTIRDPADPNTSITKYEYNKNTYLRTLAKDLYASDCPTP
jgi:hypothetical protein